MRASVVLASLLILNATAASAATSLNQAVWSSGFYPLALPSTGYEPGQVRSVTIGRDHVANSVLVCTRDQYVGPVALITAAAPAKTSIENLQTGIDITAKVKSWLTGKADFSTVRDVTLQLANVKTVSAPIASMMSVESQVPGCSAAINTYHTQGNSKYLRLIQQVLVADVNYTVAPKTKADVGAEAVAKQISGTLGANYQLTGQYTVTGPGLIIGVMLAGPKMVQAKKP